MMSKARFRNFILWGKKEYIYSLNLMIKVDFLTYDELRPQYQFSRVEDYKQTQLTSVVNIIEAWQTNQIHKA